MTELAQRSKAARKAKGMTQTELAQAAGTGQAHLSRIEKGEKNPSAGMLTAIARALDTTVSQLVGDRPAGDVSYPKGSAAAKTMADRRGKMLMRNASVASIVNMYEQLLESRPTNGRHCTFLLAEFGYESSCIVMQIGSGHSDSSVSRCSTYRRLVCVLYFDALPLIGCSFISPQRTALVNKCESFSG